MRTVRGGGTSACLAFLFSWCCLPLGWVGPLSGQRPDTEGRRVGEKNVFGMGLKDGEHSRWSE